VESAAGISAVNVTDVTIDSCTVHAHGAYGIEMRGVDSTISSCEVFDTGCVAISAVCGAMRTLTPGGCVVTNNTITRMGQTKRTYQPGLRWAGVENNFTFNRIFNGPHACVSGGGATNAFFATVSHQNNRLAKTGSGRDKHQANSKKRGVFRRERCGD